MISTLKIICPWLEAIYYCVYRDHCLRIKNNRNTSFIKYFHAVSCT